MNPNIVFQQPAVSPEINYLPAVSIILPVQHIIATNKLEHKLKLVMEKIERRLLTLYSEKKALPIITKLNNLILKLNYETRKKGIAIFVSEMVEQVYYLDADVEEKIAIDEFFEAHDEVFRKKTKYID